MVRFSTRVWVVLACAVAIFWTGVASAEETVSFTATVDGRDIATATSTNPIPLGDRRKVVIHVEVTNGGLSEVVVPTIRLDGRVIGITFVAYETAVGLVVPPGETEDRTYELDLIGIEEQATGLIPSGLSLLDPDRRILASRSFTVDVRGSLLSVYGVFGIASIALAAYGFGSGLLALARGRLAASRWTRAVRFAIPGFSLGLTLTFAASALRIFAPRAPVWMPTITVCFVGAFLLGYLTPAPAEEEEMEEALTESQ